VTQHLQADELIEFCKIVVEYSFSRLTLSRRRSSSLTFFLPFTKRGLHLSCLPPGGGGGGGGGVFAFLLRGGVGGGGCGGGATRRTPPPPPPLVVVVVMMMGWFLMGRHVV
jgi:hypothetical protein